MEREIRLTESSVNTPMDPLKFFADINHASSPKKAMRDLCHRARLHCNMTQPPFGLMKLAQMLHVEVRRTTRLPNKIYGRLERHDSRFIIVISEYLPWRRSRTTIAHELGHVLLIRSLGKYPEALAALRAPENWKAVEALCDFAAAELLVPLDDLWNYAFPDLLSIYNSDLHVELYDRYLVSYAALFRRFLDIGVDAVFLWRAMSDNDLDWRLASAYHNKDYYIPPKMSARNHLFPNFLDSVDSDISGWTISASEVEFRVKEEVMKGNCIAVDSIPHRKQPLFEGFKIADEPHLAGGAIMLMRFNY